MLVLVKCPRCGCEFKITVIDIYERIECLKCEHTDSTLEFSGVREILEEVNNKKSPF